MSTYSSKPVAVNRPQNEIYGKLSDFSYLQQRIAEMPEDARAKVGSVKFTADSITIDAPAVGAIVLNVTKRIEPSLIRLEAQSSPVPLGMELTIEPNGVEGSLMRASIDVEIPVMLRPLVGGKLQEAANKFGEMLSGMFGNE